MGLFPPSDTISEHNDLRVCTSGGGGAPAVLNCTAEAEAATMAAMRALANMACVDCVFSLLIINSAAALRGL